MSKNKLTRADIIENLFNKCDVSKKNIHRIIELVFEEIKQGILDDKIVELRGFGTFEIRMRKGRNKARNPKTGEIFAVENHGVTVFRPGQEMKKKVWPMRK